MFADAAVPLSIPVIDEASTATEVIPSIVFNSAAVAPVSVVVIVIALLLLASTMDFKSVTVP